MPYRKEDVFSAEKRDIKELIVQVERHRRLRQLALKSQAEGVAPILEVDQEVRYVARTDAAQLVVAIGEDHLPIQSQSQDQEVHHTRREKENRQGDTDHLAV